MNIYVLTDNHYLFAGISHFLKKHKMATVTRFPLHNPQATKIIDICCVDDVFIIDMDVMSSKFYLMKKIYDSKHVTSIIKSRSSLSFMKPFYTHMFPGIFTISELNNIFMPPQHRVSVRRKKKSLITQHERTILDYFIKGCSVSLISDFLEISQKSIYTHQRNICNKLGIRRSCDIAALPSGFMEYLNLDRD